MTNQQLSECKEIMDTLKLPLLANGLTAIERNNSLYRLREIIDEEYYKVFTTDHQLRKELTR